MATEILIKNGTPIVWADTTDYNPAAGVVYARTVAIDLTSLANGAYRQGAKADLGVVRASSMIIRACFEPDVTLSAGVIVPVWFAFSKSVDAAVDNPGGVSGSDAGYSGTTGGTAAQSVKQLVGPFNWVATPDVAAISLPMDIGVLSPTQRYISSVVGNLSGQAFEGDAVEMYLALIPIINESQ